MDTKLDDEMLLHKLRHSSELTAVPLVAVGDVHMHVRSRKPLQDVLTATRMRMPLTECGLVLEQNAEQHLRSRLHIAQRYPAALIQETLRVTTSSERYWQSSPNRHFGLCPPGNLGQKYLCIPAKAPSGAHRTQGPGRLSRRTDAD